MKQHILLAAVVSSLILFTNISFAGDCNEYKIGDSLMFSVYNITTYTPLINQNCNITFLNYPQLSVALSNISTTSQGTGLYNLTINASLTAGSKYVATTYCGTNTIDSYIFCVVSNYTKELAFGTGVNLTDVNMTLLAVSRNITNVNNTIVAVGNNITNMNSTTSISTVLSAISSLLNLMGLNFTQTNNLVYNASNLVLNVGNNLTNVNTSLHNINSTLNANILSVNTTANANILSANSTINKNVLAVGDNVTNINLNSVLSAISSLSNLMGLNFTYTNNLINSIDFSILSDMISNFDKFVGLNFTNTNSLISSVSEENIANNFTATNALITSLDANIDANFTNTNNYITSVNDSVLEVGNNLTSINSTLTTLLNSILAEIADIPADVWAYGTKVLTSYGTLINDIWTYGSIPELNVTITNGTQQNELYNASQGVAGGTTNNYYNNDTYSTNTTFNVILPIS